METIEQQPTMGNPGAKIPRTAAEKEKNMAATSSPSYGVSSPHAPLRLLLTDMDSPWRCFGEAGLGNYSHNNIK